MLEPAITDRNWVSEAKHGTRTVDAWLDDLQISREHLTKSIRAGITERRQASPFEPNAAPGWRDWIARVGTLRQQLDQEGWHPINPANAPLIRRSDDKILLGVMPGDKGTGDISKPLSSSYPKGVTTANLTLNNDTVAQPLFDLDQLRDINQVDARKVWFLVTHLENSQGNTDGVIHLELAQPAPTSSGTTVTSWAKRCCLTPIDAGPRVDPEPTPSTPVNVTVTPRR